MSSGSSMQVTIGSALGRAWDQNQAVDILVEGIWLSGGISQLDGLGVVIDGENFERYVVRLEQIAVVRIRSYGSQPALPAHEGSLGVDDVA